MASRTTLQEIQAMPRAQDSQNAAIMFTVCLSLFIALVLGALAWRAKQYWLLTWSIGLFISAVAYLAVVSGLIAIDL